MPSSPGSSSGPAASGAESPSDPSRVLAAPPELPGRFRARVRRFFRGAGVWVVGLVVFTVSDQLVYALWPTALTPRIGHGEMRVATSIRTFREDAKGLREVRFRLVPN